MTRDDKRNEIIRTFRKFSRLNLDNERLNPIQAYRRIDALCSSRRSKLDMLAVHDTMRLLLLGGEERVCDAVRAVYFADGSCRLSRNEISRRIARAALEGYCDERTVYRRLERARELYSSLRKCEGLLWDGVSDLALRSAREKLD